MERHDSLQHPQGRMERTKNTEESNLRTLDKTLPQNPNPKTGSEREGKKKRISNNQRAPLGNPLWTS